MPSSVVCCLRCSRSLSRSTYRYPIALLYSCLCPRSRSRSRLVKSSSPSSSSTSNTSVTSHSTSTLRGDATNIPPPLPLPPTKDGKKSATGREGSSTAWGWLDWSKAETISNAARVRICSVAVGIGPGCTSGWQWQHVACTRSRGGLLGSTYLLVAALAVPVAGGEESVDSSSFWKCAKAELSDMYQLCQLCWYLPAPVGGWVIRGVK